MQALAQYLVNLNVWTHNVLTVLARSRAKRTSSLCDVRHAGMHQPLGQKLAYELGLSCSMHSRAMHHDTPHNTNAYEPIVYLHIAYYLGQIKVSIALWR